MTEVQYKKKNTTLVYQAIPPKHTFPAPYLHTWVKKSLGRTMNSPDRLTKDSKKAGNSELLFWAWTEVMWWWSLARDLWVSSHPPSYSHHRPLQKIITVQPFSRSMVPEPLLYTEVYLFGSTPCPALAQIPSPPVRWCSTSPKTNVLLRIHRPRTPRLSTTLPKESIVIQMSELLWKVFLNKGTSLNSLNRNTNCSFHSYPLQTQWNGKIKFLQLTLLVITNMMGVETGDIITTSNLLVCITGHFW